jgi:methyl-accepting chemotaxis protein
MKAKGSHLKRNSISLGIAAVILLVIVGLSYRQWKQYTVANVQAAQTREVIQSVDKLLLSLVDAETGQRGFLLTGENRYLEPYNQAIQTIPAELAKLNQFLASRPNESSNVSRLKSLVDQKLSELRQTISLRQTQGIAPAVNVVISDQGKTTMDEIRSVCAEIQSGQHPFENQASLDREAAARITLLATTSGALILLLFFVAGFAPLTIRDPQPKTRPWPVAYGCARAATSRGFPHYQ